MKQHYDVCVVGFWYGHNYGSLLNGYAEYQLLKQLGKEVLMLQKPNAGPDDLETKQGHNVDFVKKYYDPDDISPSYEYSRLKDVNDLCDCFIAGSDQIWNYNLSFHENLYLPFVNNDKKLISFATSFGHKNDKTPDGAKPRIRRYLQRFNAISVREKFDLDILSNNYGLNGTLVFEPVFCINKETYRALANESSFHNNKPYLLAYILDPTPEKKRAIEEYSKHLGLEYIIMLDGNASRFELNKQLIDLPHVISELNANTFLKAIIDASFVLTDSFHGTAFSIIFEKDFAAIGNYGRGFERFSDLLNRVGLIERLITNPNNITIDEKTTSKIDYKTVSTNVNNEVRKTIEWFKNALNTPKNDLPNVVSHNIYPDLERVRVLVSLVKSYGIKHIVMSSGTRNVSLARMFEGNDDFFTIHRVTDERSAAYYALGLATKLKDRVAICCTSGTAASNYVPGITEAYYQKVPILVITADRYPSLHGNLEDQTIIQYGLFDTIVKKSVTLPTGQNVRDMWETKVKVCDAILELTHNGLGPTHINVPQSGLELHPSPRYALILPRVKKIDRLTLHDSKSLWAKYLDRLVKCKRIMVIYGQSHPLDAEQSKLFNEFTSKFNCVVMADHLSNIDGKFVIYPYRLLRKISNEDYNKSLTPDLVIQIGGKRILNCPLQTKIRAGSNDVEVWRVSEDGRVADLYRRLTCVWECSSDEFFEYCVTNSPANLCNDQSYYKEWQSRLDALPYDNPQNWSTYYIMSKMAEYIPENSMIHLGVGNTFVQIQNYQLRKNIEVFCNMGTNGIDGCASSFVGQANAAEENQLCFLLIGDLSFFYDMNSVWNKKLPKNMRILLCNDGGAGLLRYHNSPALTQEHGAIAEGWVKTLGFKYIRATNKDEFDRFVTNFVSTDHDVPVFLEVFVP